MEKINFVNGTAPALNATNLNKMQTNVENAINGIIESGSNVNGSWIKWADGTMICRKKVNTTVSNWKTWANMYEGSFELGNFPQSFIEIPDVHVSNNSASGWWIEAHGNISMISAGTLYINRPNLYENLTVDARILAIGRWK